MRLFVRCRDPVDSVCEYAAVDFTRAYARRRLGPLSAVSRVQADDELAAELVCWDASARSLSATPHIGQELSMDSGYA